MLLPSIGAVAALPLLAAAIEFARNDTLTPKDPDWSCTEENVQHCFSTFSYLGCAPPNYYVAERTPTNIICVDNAVGYSWELLNCPNNNHTPCTSDGDRNTNPHPKNTTATGTSDAEALCTPDACIPLLFSCDESNKDMFYVCNQYGNLTLHLPLVNETSCSAMIDHLNHTIFPGTLPTAPSTLMLEGITIGKNNGW
ncbi:MAG: hypothetical protein M1838_002829 [Thelocarpon superellum]|nr:MAG: hypothetical protein M1838_002829 [Thelocarpon superellum]